MSTVLRCNGLRFCIYANDHRPAHVHVIGVDGEAAFFLQCPDGPPELCETCGFGRYKLGRIRNLLGACLMTLCEHWSSLHGNT